MTIKNELRALSRDLAKLGLREVYVENSLADDSFRVVYVNKQVKQQAAVPGKKKKDTSS
ncbi:hypothetical protein [Chitinophaga cymbidii]|uniref:Uncharacterized protein n=1 Tax=Chitinophaga cymbidii TaxID=1096750 RepID=A0A512RHU9_9BACT|nr:hypothetical protein [Chitinophaga cymbidii]GEP95275.1 hypothetical protein CCY01nite_15350 [Chitinophaga cymbidii]